MERPARHGHPRRLREPLDAPARGPPGARRRLARALRAGSRSRRPRVIVPLEDDHVWLVEQHRHPVGRRFWEFPQGAWEEAPDAARRTLARGELAEETGLRAGAMERLGTLFFAYGISDQRFDVWLASGLEPGAAAPEATEHGPALRALRPWPSSRR